MAEEAKDGGYDCDLIEEPPDDLVCPICLLPPRKPHLISCCGRKLCHSCVDRVQQAGQPCPCCRGEQYVIVIDKMVERQVLDLKVYCKNKSKGCPWSGELRDLEKHTKSCYVASAKLLAEKNEIIEKQAEDIKRLEEKNKELTRATKGLENLLKAKREEVSAMKRSIETLNVENEQLKRQLKEMKQSLPKYTPTTRVKELRPVKLTPVPPPLDSPQDTKCPNCNSQLINDARFCTCCGCLIKWCSSCKNPMLRDAILCTKCRIPREHKISCPSCKGLIPHNVQFCKFCGGSINVKECLYCKYLISRDSPFCVRCGGPQNNITKSNIDAVM